MRVMHHASRAARGGALRPCLVALSSTHLDLNIAGVVFDGQAETRGDKVAAGLHRLCGPASLRNVGGVLPREPRAPRPHQRQLRVLAGASQQLAFCCGRSLACPVPCARQLGGIQGLLPGARSITPSVHACHSRLSRWQLAAKTATTVIDLLCLANVSDC